MSGLAGRRLDPNERAGLRLTLLSIGLVLVALLVLPLGVLVREEWSPLTDLDARVRDAAHGTSSSSSALAEVARWVTHLGAPVLLEVIAVVLVVLLVRAGRKRSAGYLACCVVGAYALSTLGKVTVDRARPVFDEPLSIARGASFPSGHATGSAAFYLALAVVLLPFVARAGRRALYAAAILVPIAVAATRVLLGVHYLSDVTAGLLLGWGWSLACTALFSAWRADEGLPAPVLTEGVEPEPAPAPEPAPESDPAP